MGEIQASEKRTDQKLQETERRIREEAQESEKRLRKDLIALVDAEFTPKFNLLAENQGIMMEKLDRLEAKVDQLEDKVLEHEFKLRIVK